MKRYCEECGRPFNAKADDVRRGWRKFCSKRCKAKRNGQQDDPFRNRKVVVATKVEPGGEQNGSPL